MFKTIFSFFALFVGPIYGVATNELIEFQPLVRDVKIIDIAESDLPRNYRTTHDEISVEDNSLGNLKLRLEGLKDLSMGGSAQFTESQLEEIVSHWNTKVTVIDLREETHLILETHEGRQIPISAFIPLNVGNEGKSINEIEYEHLRYRNHILEKGAIALPYGKGGGVISPDAPIFAVSNVYTEKEVVEKLNENHPLGVEYVYLPITDHKKPSPKIVDLFLNLMRDAQNDDNKTLIFHCRAGRGRTGMMMVMKDMLDNAKKYELTFDQILKRQELLGSPDFADVSIDKEEQSIERYAFLKHFYMFVLSPDGYDSGVPYSYWSDQHPIYEAL